MSTSLKGGERVKISVCDVCHFEGTLTETHRYLKVKGYPALHLDLCPTHMEDVRREHPRVDYKYVMFVYGVRGLTLTEEQAKGILYLRADGSLRRGARPAF